MSASDRECFTDFALQEYAQGRLDPGVRRELETHQATCAECRTALSAFTAEAIFLRAALDSEDPTAMPEPSDETLACYSGGALSVEDTAAAEALLSRHPSLLARLVALIRETAAAQTDEPVQPLPKPASVGEILRMPKRSAMPVSVVTDRRASGGQVG